MRQGLHAIAQQHPTLIETIRGWGLIDGLVLSANSTWKAIDVVKAAMSEGLLLVPAGPNVVRFVPPLIVSSAEVSQALEMLKTALAKLSSQ